MWMWLSLNLKKLEIPYKILSMLKTEILNKFKNKLSIELQSIKKREIKEKSFPYFKQKLACRKSLIMEK